MTLLCFSDAITHSSDRLQGDPNCFINQTFVPKLPLCTGKIWATYPIPNLSLAEGFLDQVPLINLALAGARL